MAEEARVAGAREAEAREAEAWAAEAMVAVAMVVVATVAGMVVVGMVVGRAVAEMAVVGMVTVVTLGKGGHRVGALACAREGGEVVATSVEHRGWVAGAREGGEQEEEMAAFVAAAGVVRMGDSTAVSTEVVTTEALREVEGWVEGREGAAPAAGCKKSTSRRASCHGSRYHNTCCRPRTTCRGACVSQNIPPQPATTWQRRH